MVAWPTFLPSLYTLYQPPDLRVLFLCSGTGSDYAVFTAFVQEVTMAQSVATKFGRCLAVGGEPTVNLHAVTIGHHPVTVGNCVVPFAKTHMPPNML